MGGKLISLFFLFFFKQSNLTRILSQQYKKDLGDKFEMHTAFSRDGPQKVYVQHKLKENAAEINKLLEQRAFFYVCGDAANMAREVNGLLGQIISKERGVPESKGEEIVKQMRSSNQYQEDVWS
jgi:NADPH-ferrihemoprotein reductase